MLRDRGTMKWTSLMLPEHVEMMKKMWEEDGKLPPPSLEEQALSELNDACIEAHENQAVVRIKVYSNGELKQLEGTITHLIPQEQSLRMVTVTGNTKAIAIGHIYNID
ncbi:YolD-like family protein [Pontibacillus sp. ALD_SL1]|uniref:YolD-like family protein n=1 Tax=Pontibacillus sp. ALD_SL1 TaxID=2777185 RepID=UPI001A958FFC|nr:YolD-like family protein [Pontibacillus sp. ALD_SL1]QSS98397.1 YolD-like family protein [Pontibacillus sp. ALD_SL1]